MASDTKADKKDWRNGFVGPESRPGMYIVFMSNRAYVLEVAYKEVDGTERSQLHYHWSGQDWFVLTADKKFEMEREFPNCEHYGPIQKSQKRTYGTVPIPTPDAPLPGDGAKLRGVRPVENVPNAEDAADGEG